MTHLIVQQFTAGRSNLVNKGEIMSQLPTIPDSDAENAASGWESLYKLGGAAALALILVSLLDLALTFLPAGATPDPGQGSVIDWFRLIQDNWFLGLRGLGLWNIITSVSAVLVFLALYGAHRRVYQADAALAVLLLCIGATIYITNNTALPMLTLSEKYSLATSEAQKSQLVAAGQVLLAQAEDFTPGSFVGFFITEVAEILMALLMLRSGLFGKSTAWVGLLGFVLLLVFTIWSTFIPVFYAAALLVAALGGLLSMIWFLLVARRLFQLGRSAALPALRAAI
jgi:hypothetical protein